MKTYSIQVTCRQGASDGFVGTKEMIDNYLSGWADPENLCATIDDEAGQMIAYKPYGRKTIPWEPNQTTTNPFEAMQAAMIAGHKDDDEIQRSPEDQKLIETLVARLNMIEESLDMISANSDEDHIRDDALMLFFDVQKLNKDL